MARNLKATWSHVEQVYRIHLGCIQGASRWAVYALICRLFGWGHGPSMVEITHGWASYGLGFDGPGQKLPFEPIKQGFRAHDRFLQLRAESGHPAAGGDLPRRPPERGAREHMARRGADRRHHPSAGARQRIAQARSNLGARSRVGSDPRHRADDVAKGRRHMTKGRANG